MMKPFDLFQTTPESYESTPRAITMTRILQAFLSVFGLPSGRVSTEFRAALQKTIDVEYPYFRCSVARAVLEGRIPGVPPPLTLHREQKQLRQALFLLDALETMAAVYVEGRLKSVAPELRSEVELLKRTMGTAYVPGILSLFKEKSHAFQEQETAQRDGRGGPRRQVGDSQKGRQGISRGGQGRGEVPGQGVVSFTS